MEVVGWVYGEGWGGGTGGEGCRVSGWRGVCVGGGLGGVGGVLCLTIRCHHQNGIVLN